MRPAEVGRRTLSRASAPRCASSVFFRVSEPERLTPKVEFGRQFGRTAECSTFAQVDGLRPSVCSSDIEMERLRSNAPTAGLCSCGSFDQTNQK